MRPSGPGLDGVPAGQSRCRLRTGEYPAGRTVTAKYVSQATTKKVNLTVMEINGETGALIDKIHYEVTPEQAATYTPAPKDGLVPWSGNMEPITYAWEDLEKGTDVLQYVYYVPKDYTPGDTYDITVQYMNIANSQILRSETITIDPETNDFVNILGEERFSLGDDTYVRLAGQETAIRHAYFSPARTYTIYYRDVNDELSSQITIRPHADHRYRACGDGSGHHGDDCRSGCRSPRCGRSCCRC